MQVVAQILMDMLLLMGVQEVRCVQVQVTVDLAVVAAAEIQVVAAEADIPAVVLHGIFPLMVVAVDLIMQEPARPTRQLIMLPATGR